MNKFKSHIRNAGRDDDMRSVVGQVHAHRCRSLLLALIGLIGLCANPVTAQDQRPRAASSEFAFLTDDYLPALEPYAVTVRLIVPGNVAPLIQAEQWAEDLRVILTNTWGAAVDLTVAVQGRGPIETDSPPERSANAPQNTDPGRAEIELSMRDRPDGWSITSRAWSELRQQWETGEPVGLRNADLIPRYLARAATEMFSPVVQIHDVQFETASGILRAGELAVPESSPPLLVTGDLLQVLLVYSNRDQQIVSRQTLPWTYLQVTDRQRGRITTEPASAFASPIPRSRRRVDLYATKVTPRFPHTLLQIQTRSQPPRPHAIQQVLLSPWHTQSPEVTGVERPRIALMTDRSGQLLVQREEVRGVLGSGLIKIEVLSGESVVARLPWLPGQSQQLLIEVPDDAARVRAFLAIEQLESRLLRVAAKRATLVAALKQLADQPREIDARPLLTQFEQLPALAVFQKELEQIRIPAVDELNRLGNRTAARQVEKRCEESLALVKRHLPPESIDELKDRLGLK